jgi:YVTN family beta-propeller protein
MLALLAGCGGGGSALPLGSNNHSGPAAKGSVPATFTIEVPAKTSGTSSTRRPAYVSPATQSILIVIDSGDPDEQDIFQNVSSGSPGCTTPSPISPLTCTISLSVTPGPHVFNMLTFDLPLVGGSLNPLAQPLSTNLDFPFTVVAGTNNNIPIVLQGLPVNVLVLAGSGQDVTGTTETGFSLWGAYKADEITLYPRTFTVVAVDADLNYIVGPGAPALTMVSSDSSTMSDGVAATNNPNEFTITPKAYVSSEQFDYTITATASTASGSNSGFGSPVIVQQPISVVARNAPRIYVANSYANNVSVYDEQGNAVTPTAFPVGVQPSGITYDSHNGFTYVADQSYVQAYDSDGNPKTLTGSFAGGQAVGVVYDPHNGHLYVGNPTTGIGVFDEQGNSIAVTGTWLDPSSVLAFAYGGIYDPDNGDLYFADKTNKLIERYDENGNFVAEWSDTNAPTSIVRSPSTGWLYVATQNGGIDIFDDSGNPMTLTGSSFDAVYGLTPWGIAYDPANGQYYTTAVSLGISAFDLNGNDRALAGPFGGLDVPLGLAVVP